ncbi:MAG: hypothetical protein V1755_09745, partial [Chloroflexota bacterium]
MNIASVFQAVAAATWIAFVAVLGTTLVRGGRGQPARGFTTLMAVLLVAAILLTSVGAGLVCLQADQDGIVSSAFLPSG